MVDILHPPEYVPRDRTCPVCKGIINGSEEDIWTSAIGVRRRYYHYGCLLRAIKEDIVKHTPDKHLWDGEEAQERLRRMAEEIIDLYYVHIPPRPPRE